MVIHTVIVTNKNYKELNPVQFGFAKCDKSHHYGPATRTHWLIHYVESGFGIFRINNKEYSVGPGEMFVIPPFVESYYEADSENPWSYIWIGFTTENTLPVELNDVVHSPHAAVVFNAMKACEDLLNGRSSFLCSKLWKLFTLLLEDEKHNTSYVDKALDCIHSEYMYDLTIKEIAMRIGLDHSYFSSLFLKKMGISPKQYLLNYRMNIAISLMIEKGNSISVAAYSVGYTDVCNFSKVFKKHFGVSPREYVKTKKEA